MLNGDLTEAHGGNVWQSGDPAEWLDYSANIRPDGAPDWVRDALTSALDRIGYYPPLDRTGSSRALGAYLGIAPELCLATAGGASAIALAVSAAENRVLVPAPCFREYAAAAENRGLSVVQVPLLKEDRTWRSPAEAFGPLLEERDLVWLCNPLNPTGHGFSLREIANLLAAAEQAGAMLAVDEAFIDYCPENSAVPFLAEHPALTVTGSFTKLLGIPGVRLGYLCGRSVASLAKLQLPWELNCFASAVLEKLPEHRGEADAEAVVNAERRSRFCEGLKTLGLTVYDSAASFVMVKFPCSASALTEAMRKKHILVRQCLEFPGLDDDRHLRLAVKTDEQNRVLLGALEAYLCAVNR